MPTNKWFYRIIFVFIFIFLMVGNTFKSEKIYSYNNEIYGLEVTPSELFNIQNMRPGYEEDYTLMLKNTGNQPLSYSIKSELSSGDELLFNQLIIKVSKEGSILYLGKLSNFYFRSQQGLAAHAQDNVKFTIGLPGESGNEYQGLSASVVIDIKAEPSSPPNPGDGDPPDNGGDPDDGGNPDDGDDPGDGDNPDDGDGTNPPDDNNPPTDDHEPPSTNEPPNTNEPPSNNPTPTKPNDSPAKNTGSLPQTGEENPILIIMSGFILLLAGLSLLLIKKSIIPNPFKRG
ncbi:LPXTG cell wall anchor domain-containing protein [Fictibacillus sp. 7GRE50]|uniref:LPXTG cell wall anchor domain-containing protein n=1 Tax=Fictibacillus sp. 7GRE50 TaxID=2745878 RepID=UPI0018CE50E7|nr:LPXTG cell wall anchor domain-containing protein [Fictibacillus sp. 7GRE50]MBH0164247.1 LPXTG cell wall anchor domain-containing protein [Fictibacillus sp. 7GRE50]